MELRRPGVSAPTGNSGPAERDLAPGEKLGRYAILESVGRGAMGVVYAAYDSELDRKIALKVLNPERRNTGPIAPARLVREAKAMARLAHPNVIAIHDVGEMEGRVFLAMEFLGGGTLRTWLDARPRTWRESLDLFIAAGRGLAAAHEAGLVHRDFKPDNVLLDRQQRPRVVDFGLAREAAASDGDGESAAEASRLAERTLEPGGSHLETLTRTGVLVGTPAYMAPEQFLGEPADERSDQFSFCIALYEALCGQRPFAGDNVLSLSLSVTTGQARPIPRDRVVPNWIRRVIARGLQSRPGDRYPSMAALIAALEDDPAVRRRRRLITGGVVGVVVASLLVAGQIVRRRHQELERQIAAHVQTASGAAGQARGLAGELRRQRAQAFAAFDARDRERGEALWRQALGRVAAVHGSYERSEQAFERALVLDTGRQDLRARLADVRVEHLLLDDELGLEREASALGARLAGDDADGSRRRALAAPATLVVRVRPATATLTLERYQRDAATGRRGLAPAGAVAVGAPLSLAPGSYRLVLQAAGHAQVVYPFELARDERRTLELALPPATAVPEGFVFIPAGAFWFGDPNEKLRTDFLDTAPIHRRTTGSYLIARHETTYREWIAFLDELPPAEQAVHAPDVSTAMRGSLKLTRRGGEWQLTFQPTSHRYTARPHQPFVYVGRTRRAEQTWLDFPVAAISPADVERYLLWLRQTGKVPGARLCTEAEWERAARGADDRVYPHGDELERDDANFDLTYGRLDSAFGPDAVGAHPATRSPFGLDDLAGNILELTRSSLDNRGLVVRGGAYYFNAATCRSTNRNSVPDTIRDLTIGVRICASLEGTDDAKNQQD